MQNVTVHISYYWTIIVVYITINIVAGKGVANFNYLICLYSS